MKRLVYLTILLLTGCASKQHFLKKHPKLWEDSLYIFDKKEIEDIWFIFYEKDGINIDIFLNFAYKTFLSKDDGDNQFLTAQALSCLKKDPYASLNRCLESDDPYMVIYSAEIIGMLGDKRFYSKLKSLKKDNRKLDYLLYDTVGEHIDYSIKQMFRQNGDLHSPEISKYAEEWLVKARQIKVKPN